MTKTEDVHFWEEEAVLSRVDRLAQKRGTNRTALYREAMRFYLDSDRVTPEEKKNLSL